MGSTERLSITLLSYGFEGCWVRVGYSFSQFFNLEDTVCLCHCPTVPVLSCNLSTSKIKFRYTHSYYDVFVPKITKNFHLNYQDSQLKSLSMITIVQYKIN